MTSTLTNTALSSSDLESAPALIRHLAAVAGSDNADVTFTKQGDGYRVEIDVTDDRRLEFTLARRGRRWSPRDAKFTVDGDEVDLKGGLTGILRAMSQAGNLVGSPAANTRHQGANPTLVARAHTIIRN